ncbi:MAG: hypothetical protein RLZZ09_648 [Pseudomonadota bacterium]|jgi:hypothetical protein
MKKPTIACALMVGLISLSSGGFAASTPQCTLKTLKGTYIYSTQGLSNGALFGEAGQEVYDGKGTVTNNFTASDGSSGTVTGTYTVTANCQARVTYSSGEDITLYVSPRGDVFTYIYNNTGEGNSKFGTETRTSLGFIR